MAAAVVALVVMGLTVSTVAGKDDADEATGLQLE